MDNIGTIDTNEKVVILKDGKEVECDILFTFDCEETQKSYIGYSDNSIAENGRKNIYVSSYDPHAENIVFENITDPNEMKMVQDVLVQLDEDSRR
ncbi:uncharacterized protein BN801_01132 [Mycoplasma sp. CAG:877]|nr:uncharacterized protein BN801_01132 [Mycoplasma sp. CAG:877]